MKKILETGHQDYVASDRIAIYVSGGAGNLPGTPEIHITLVDPEDDTEIGAWFPRDALISAILDPSTPHPKHPSKGARTSMTATITLFTKPVCVQCNAVRRFLADEGAPFVEEDLTAPANAPALERFKEQGLMAAPVTEFAGRAVAGFDPDSLREIVAEWRQNRPEAA